MFFKFCWLMFGVCNLWLQSNVTHVLKILIFSSSISHDEYRVKVDPTLLRSICIVSLICIKLRSEWLGERNQTVNWSLLDTCKYIIFHQNRTERLSFCIREDIRKLIRTRRFDIFKYKSSLNNLYIILHYV